MPILGVGENMETEHMFKTRVKEEVERLERQKQSMRKEEREKLVKKASAVFACFMTVVVIVLVCGLLSGGVKFASLRDAVTSTLLMIGVLNYWAQ